MTKLLLRSLLLFIFCVAIHSPATYANESNAIWQDVKRGSNMVIMRHALAPGTGDPNNFDVNNCDTQRNLSAAGRQQALRIGSMLKGHGIDSAAIYTSPWCRCIETASAMQIDSPTGTPLVLPELSSFYSNPQAGPAQINNLTQWLRELNPTEPVVLVTHQVVISALTGIYPASGEAVVFNIDDDNNITVVERVKTK